MGSPLTAEQIATRLASTMRAAAKAADDEWCISLLLARPLFLNEGVESVEVVSGPARVTELGELVRLYPDKHDDISLFSVICLLLAREIEPFVIGVGKVVARQSEEGGIVLLRDLCEEGRVVVSHGDPFRQVYNAPTEAQLADNDKKLAEVIYKALRGSNPRALFMGEIPDTVLIDGSFNFLRAAHLVRRYLKMPPES